MYLAMWGDAPNHADCPQTQATCPFLSVTNNGNRTKCPDLTRVHTLTIHWRLSHLPSFGENRSIGQYLYKCNFTTAWQVSTSDKCLSCVQVLGTQPTIFVSKHRKHSSSFKTNGSPVQGMSYAADFRLLLAFGNPPKICPSVLLVPCPGYPGVRTGVSKQSSR